MVKGLDRMRPSVKLKTDLSDQSIKSIAIIRQFYHVVWSAERIQKVNSQVFERLHMGKLCYFLGMKYVAIRNPHSSKCKMPVDCWPN